MWFNRKYFKSVDTLVKENGKKTGVYPTIHAARAWASENEPTVQVVQHRIDAANRKGYWYVYVYGFDTKEEVKYLVVLLRDAGYTANLELLGKNTWLYISWKPEQYSDEEEGDIE